jgi:NhaP-type Na+/H+ or K+/H+ antiporter
LPPVEGAHPALTLVLALAVGVLAQSVARHLRLPGIVLLLAAGASLGPDGLGWVEPTALGEGLLTLVELSVAIILFEGGLNLEISRLRREGAAIRRLVLGGALVTLAGGAAAVALLLDWDWTTALVFGSLVVVTGPTVIGPLVQDLRLRPRVATVLEAEGVLIDPVGAILAVLMLEVALAPGADSVRSGTQELVTQVGFGAIMGVIGGFAVAFLLRVRRLIPEGYENIAVLASVLLLFQLCNEVTAPSGLLAVPIAGVVVGNLRSSVDRDLREFKDQLTILLIGMLFVLLAASVRIDDVLGLGWQGLAVVGVLVFLVRPVAVYLSTVGTELDWRERLLVMWIAPRGIVAAAVASATAVALERAGVGGGRELLALVFLTIASTVVLAGLTAPLVARALRQRLPGRDGFAILGAQGLGFLLARELRDADVPVVFVDSNPQNCRRAQEEGFTVVYGNALQERTLQRTRIETVGTVIGLTPNQMLNSVFVSRARERFSVPRAYVAVEQLEIGLAPELVKEEAALVLFDGPHDVERWDVRFRHGDVEVEPWVFRGAPEPDAGEERPPPPEIDGDRFVVLVVRRNGKLEPMHAGLVLKAGDESAVAIRREEREAGESDLRALGWEPKTEADAAA